MSDEFAYEPFEIEPFEIDFSKTDPVGQRTTSASLLEALLKEMELPETTKPFEFEQELPTTAPVVVPYSNREMRRALNDREELRAACAELMEIHHGSWGKLIMDPNFDPNAKDSVWESEGGAYQTMLEMTVASETWKIRKETGFPAWWTPDEENDVDATELRKAFSILESVASDAPKLQQIRRAFGECRKRLLLHANASGLARAHADKDKWRERFRAAIAEDSTVVAAESALLDLAKAVQGGFRKSGEADFGDVMHIADEMGSGDDRWAELYYDLSKRTDRHVDGTLGVNSSTWSEAKARMDLERMVRDLVESTETRLAVFLCEDLHAEYVRTTEGTHRNENPEPDSPFWFVFWMTACWAAVETGAFPFLGEPELKDDAIGGKFAWNWAPHGQKIEFPNMNEYANHLQKAVSFAKAQTERYKPSGAEQAAYTSDRLNLGMAAEVVAKYFSRERRAVDAFYAAYDRSDPEDASLEDKMGKVAEHFRTKIEGSFSVMELDEPSSEHRNQVKLDRTLLLCLMHSYRGYKYGLGADHPIKSQLNALEIAVSRTDFDRRKDSRTWNEYVGTEVKLLSEFVERELHLSLETPATEDEVEGFLISVWNLQKTNALQKSHPTAKTSDYAVRFALCGLALGLGALAFSGAVLTPVVSSLATWATSRVTEMMGGASGQKARTPLARHPNNETNRILNNATAVYAFKDEGGLTYNLVLPAATELKTALMNKGVYTIDEPIVTSDGGLSCSSLYVNAARAFLFDRLKDATVSHAYRDEISSFDNLPLAGRLAEINETIQTITKRHESILESIAPIGPVNIFTLDKAVHKLSAVHALTSRLLSATSGNRSVYKLREEVEIQLTFFRALDANGGNIVNTIKENDAIDTLRWFPLNDAQPKLSNKDVAYGANANMKSFSNVGLKLSASTDSENDEYSVPGKFASSSLWNLPYAALRMTTSLSGWANDVFRHVVSEYVPHATVSLLLRKLNEGARANAAIRVRATSRMRTMVESALGLGTSWGLGFYGSAVTCAASMALGKAVYEIAASENARVVAAVAAAVPVAISLGQLTGTLVGLGQLGAFRFFEVVANRFKHHSFERNLGYFYAVLPESAATLAFAFSGALAMARPVDYTAYGYALGATEVALCSAWWLLSARAERLKKFYSVLVDAQKKLKQTSLDDKGILDVQRSLRTWAKDVDQSGIFESLALGWYDDIVGFATGFTDTYLPAARETLAAKTLETADAIAWAEAISRFAFVWGWWTSDKLSKGSPFFDTEVAQAGDRLSRNLMEAASGAETSAMLTFSSLDYDLGALREVYAADVAMQLASDYGVYAFFYLPNALAVIKLLREGWKK